MRKPTTTLGRGLIPVERPKMSEPKDPVLDEETIAKAALVTGLDPADIRNAVLRLVELGAVTGDEIPIFLNGPKAEGTVYVRRGRG